VDSAHYRNLPDTLYLFKYCTLMTERSMTCCCQSWYTLQRGSLPQSTEKTERQLMHFFVAQLLLTAAHRNPACAPVFRLLYLTFWAVDL